MSVDFVADTMAVVLDYEQRRMPNRVKALFEAARAGKLKIGVSAMTLAEVGYLAEKRRIEVQVADFVAAAPGRGLVLLALDAPIVTAAFQITDIPELHDRLIAATARHYGVPLLTNDPIIRAAAVGPTVWE